MTIRNEEGGPNTEEHTKDTMSRPLHYPSMNLQDSKSN